RLNPVITTRAPCSWAVLATWNAIEASVMIPVTRIVLPSSSPDIGVRLLRCSGRAAVVVVLAGPGLVGPSVAHAQPAVDRQDGPGNVRRVLGGQPAHGARDFVGAARAPERDRLEDRVLLIV